MTNFKLKIASRRSRLAMVQTLWVKDQLEKNIPNLEVSVEAMATPVSYTHLTLPTTPYV